MICHLGFVKLISPFQPRKILGISNEYLDSSCIPKKSDKESRFSCLAFQMMLLEMEKETCFTWQFTFACCCLHLNRWVQSAARCGGNGTGTKNLQSHGDF